MGSAAAAECAARGADVIGFEQFDFAHDRSSSHGESRIVRLAYLEHSDYVPLLRRAEVDGFSIETDRGEFRASRMIVTAGPWTARLLRSLGVPLVVTRQATAWFQVEREAERFHPARFPCWALARDASSFFYGFPVLSSPPSLKVSMHAPMSPADPDCVDRTMERHEVDDLRHGLATVLPEMSDAGLARTSVCLYTNTPDGHFVIDVLQDDPRVVVACGFSGHGFKFTPVVGEILADLALDGGTKLPIAFLSRRRFSEAPA